MSMFSASDSDFDTEVQERVPYIVTNAVRLTVDATRQLRMTDAKTAWDASYALASSPATNSEENIEQKDLDRVELEDAIRDVIDNIPEGLFTTEDRFRLNHPLRDTVLTQAGVMDRGPVLTVAKTTRGVTTIRCADPESQSSNALPESQKVLLAIFVGDNQGIINPIELRFHDVDLASRILKDLTFDASLIGKWCYVKGIYINTRGQKGEEWGGFLSFLIN